MLFRLLRSLAIAAGGCTLLLAAIFSTVPVGADAPPSAFTNNGCTVGNYSCLYASVTNCPVGNYSCLYANYGTAPWYLRYGVPYGVPGYPVAYAPYAQPVYAAPPAVSATVASGSTVGAGQMVAINNGGFTAGEPVIVTVTAPNGQAMQAGSGTAGSDGTVTITVAFPSAGAWKVDAHGQTSNKDVTTQLTVQ